MNVVTESLKLQMDKDGNELESQQTRMEKMLNDARRDIDKVTEEFTNLMYEFKTYKDQS